MPASWKLLYTSGDAWVPVATADRFGTAHNAWNTLTFKPVATLRIELKVQPGVSAGVQE